MIVNIKNRSTRHHSQQFHTSYGIQKWLCSKKFCLKDGAKYKVDENEYKILLKEFALYDNPNFDFTKLKHGIGSLEIYTNNRFSKFCTFCINKYRKLLNIDGKF